MLEITDINELRCNLCGETLKGNKKFYVKDEDKIYCSDCVREDRITIYIDKDEGTELGTEYDIIEYENIAELIKEYEYNIEQYQEIIDNFIKNKYILTEQDLAYKEYYEKEKNKCKRIVNNIKKKMEE